MVDALASKDAPAIAALNQMCTEKITNNVGLVFSPEAYDSHYWVVLARRCEIVNCRSSAHLKRMHLSSYEG